MKVTALAGGVGGAKLLVGLARVQEDLTAVVNTADDTEIYGVLVSPDLDIVTYWLAGMADHTRGWGIQGDTFETVGALGRLGEATWFSLGDRDFATCLLRTSRLAAGATLSEITDQLRRRLGVAVRLLPMSDDAVRTFITTADGRVLGFQEYFVKERQEPPVAGVELRGVSEAAPAPGVLKALRDADTIALCPSNPVVSVGPILGLSEVRDTLVAHPRVVAVSPIIQGKPLKGPADKLMSAVGAEVSAFGVAEMYRDFVDVFVIDNLDSGEAARIEGLGIEVIVTDTVMNEAADSERLAKAIL